MTIIISQQQVHDNFSDLNVEANNLMSVNKKFNVVIRLLDKRQENDNKRFAYFCDLFKIPDL
jgi:hypothetical protein